jgi:hypothetical protein
VQVLLDAALGAWVDDPDGGWDAFAGGAAAALRLLAPTAADGRGRLHLRRRGGRGLRRAARPGRTRASWRSTG